MESTARRLHRRKGSGCVRVGDGAGAGLSIPYSIAPAPLLEVGAGLSPLGRCWRNHLAGPILAGRNCWRGRRSPLISSLIAMLGQLHEPADNWPYGRP
ncbi:hypothetical protein QFZ79_003739 [Arthrobacter sp. V4I6]|nr:hypothetical protein [Arthrobacter sp. V1I7]MDQ0855628.1 hypothetical protein [Arthrobacter sp. V4I6]